MKRSALPLVFVGLRADVLEAEHLACPGEDLGPIAGTVVGHDALDRHAQTRIVGDGPR